MSATLRDILSGRELLGAYPVRNWGYDIARPGGSVTVIAFMEVLRRQIEDDAVTRTRDIVPQCISSDERRAYEGAVAVTIAEGLS